MNSIQALEIMRKKDSQLCIGLDLRKPDDEKLDVALSIIDQTAEFTAGYKPNRQFWLGFSTQDMQQINNRIHKYGCFSIIDHKLSDIGSSNEMALKKSKEEGFDFMTVSPFPGNIEETGVLGEKYDIGIINLVLMSNPEAVWMQKHAIDWAVQSEKHASGMVIGATTHIPPDLIQTVAEIAPTPFILAPGLGKQGGNPELLYNTFGSRVLFNVSRSITQESNIREAAKQYYLMIKNLEKGKDVEVLKDRKIS